MPSLHSIRAILLGAFSMLAAALPTTGTSRLMTTRDALPPGDITSLQSDYVTYHRDAMKQKDTNVKTCITDLSRDKHCTPVKRLPIINAAHFLCEKVDGMILSISFSNTSMVYNPRYADFGAKSSDDAPEEGKLTFKIGLGTDTGEGWNIRLDSQTCRNVFKEIVDHCDQKSTDDKRGGALSNMMIGSDLDGPKGRLGWVVLWTVDTTPDKNELCMAEPLFRVRKGEANDVTGVWGLPPASAPKYG